MKEYNEIRLELAKAVVMRDIYLNANAVNDTLDILMSKFDVDKPAVCTDNCLPHDEDYPYGILRRIVFYPLNKQTEETFALMHNSPKGFWLDFIKGIRYQFGAQERITAYDVFFISYETLSTWYNFGTKKILHLCDWYAKQGFNFKTKEICKTN